MNMKIKKTDISNFFLFAFLLYPSFRCVGFEMATLGTATPSYIRLWTLCSMILSFFLLFYKHKYESADLPIYLYCGYMLILSLYIKTKGEEVALTSLASYITTFIGTVFCTKQFKRKVISYYFILFCGLFIIEGLSFVLPGRAYFLKNRLITFIGHVQIYSMAWTCFATFTLLKLCGMNRSSKRLRMSYKRIMIYVLFIFSTILSISSGVIAAEIAMIVFIAAFFLFKYRKINHSKWLTVIFFMAMALNVLVVFYNFQEKFAALISNFGENTSLNGRTYIWSLFIPKISKSPLIGYGYKVAGVVLSAWGHENNMDYCHNTILQEVMNGGFIQLGLFIFLNLYAIRRLKKTKSIQVQHAFFCGLCAIFVIMISESVTYYNYWNIMIAIIINEDKLGLEYQNCNGGYVERAV